MSSAANPIKVVVVGGSYAGINVITQLLSSLKSSKKTIHITLVEKNDARFHRLGAFRALVDEEYGNKVWIPYTDLFPKGSPHRIIKDSLAQVYHHHVVLQSGTTVPFDYLVLCTGSSNSATTEYTASSSSAEAISITSKARAELTKSKSVVVVGGGSSGVELSGEIKNAFPDKKVTLIHATSALVDYPGYADSLKSSSLKHLQGLGVNVVLNERAHIEGLDYEHPIRNGPTTIRLTSGQTIESDMQFYTVGIKINTSYISTLKPEGQDNFDPSTLVHQDTHVIKVRKTLQLANDSFPHIFALGDCADFSKVPTAAACSSTGPTAAKNLVALIEASASTSTSDIRAAEKTAKLAEASGSPAFMILATGPKTGVTSLPLFGSNFGNFFSKLIKSKDLMLSSIIAGMKTSTK
ncbi:hypothetical protein BC939DRAFT_475536 [Gamsiella multidivaricata]|uniref:uncharacterized protein n=1 Tax=Gamsiella multidivaricata TaxID=101098 RepID=UPI00221E5F7D|nr:uncharacterized protein BC939DRAFT_475536 [Gamsiella multidivaricata]KAG0358547.1 Apoptosis-inducing factor 2 [Gamsiella multidivaricata]KAI7827173.1 hypothetical protein BC939DRAFT_475536 [Gamsiella multidivaricata]